ncbi:DnaB-like helicase C-terminal domain-containing protein, partial [Candidatus Parcubacteria bacterium]|nr:DnaB-like helicase C-terminal domain-containing protein [Candidatus Parcubacteria bacterium]
CSVGVFSLEMSTDQVVDRLIAIEGNTSLYHLRTGRLSKEHQTDVHEALDRLTTIPIFVDDSASLNILQMRAMARRLQAESGHKLGLLIIDYLQLMVPRKDYASMVQQVTEISRGLKALAKELNLPIIALSQLSRAVEQRDGHKRPRLSDLRDSGSIEQDADLVLFIHREDKTKDIREVNEEDKNKAELIIAKHRNGPTGSVDFVINPDSLEFTIPDHFHNEEYLGSGGGDMSEAYGNLEIEPI